MKLIGSLALLLCLIHKAPAQDSPHQSVILNEIRSFIDTVRPMTVLRGKYCVYVMKVNTDYDPKKYSSCITLCYVRNDYDLPFTYCNYYFTLDSNLVLAYMPDSISLARFKSFDLTRITSDNMQVILDRLCPPNDRISGTPKAEVLYFKGDKLSKEFYFNSDLMPEALSIFDVKKIKNNVIIREIDPITQEPLQPLPPEVPRSNNTAKQKDKKKSKP